MIDLQETSERLRQHLQMLTVTIGERSVYRPDNLEKARAYIESFYQDLGLAVENQPYAYENLTVANVITRIDSGDAPSRRYLLGAHYDSVVGTVGADDNAAAIAVQLETARRLQETCPHPEIEHGGEVRLFRSRRTARLRDSPYGQQGLCKESQERRRGAGRHDLPRDGGLFL